MNFLLPLLRRDAEEALRLCETNWDEQHITEDDRFTKMNSFRIRLKNVWAEVLKEENESLLKHRVLEERKELERWWKNCFLSEAERLAFQEFYSKDYTEDLLILHKEEVERLKKYHKTNQSIYNLIKKHQDLWNRVVNVDFQATNPDRLFKNRGAQLLQEEKDRKAAQKDLPRLEEHLQKVLKTYERQNCKPFLIYGERFEDLIKRQKEEHKENQRLKKLARKEAFEVQNDPEVAAKTKKSAQKLATPRNQPSCEPLHESNQNNILSESSAVATGLGTMNQNLKITDRATLPKLKRRRSNSTPMKTTSKVPRMEQTGAAVGLQPNKRPVAKKGLLPRRRPTAKASQNQGFGTVGITIDWKLL